MPTTKINIRIDASLKKEAEALFDDLGLNMASAITLFLKSVVRYNGIPFETKHLTPNLETMAALAEYEEMTKNPDRYKCYNSFAEAMDDVHSDD